ncbi:MAG: cation transporter [Propionibacteriaceae bacterium]|jgi:copper chaperone CopZ|nr:cation transporter [Propionibacteriaceae bacterium]
METTYSVTGMTCKNCVAHVQEEVSELPGVDGVSVNLDGTMIISSGVPLDFETVAVAVAEAGNYTLSAKPLTS